MKKIFLSLALSALVAAACQKSEVAQQNFEYETFTASAETFDLSTRTSMTPEKYVVWSADDRLAIFQGSTVADEYKASDASAGKVNGTFSIVSGHNSVDGDFVAGTEMNCNVALYPYAEDLSLTGSALGDEGVTYNIDGVVLPATQNYVAGSFGEGTFPMVAVTESISDHTLKFKNLLGAMKLQLKGSYLVKSIRIEGGNSEKLSGAASVTAYANNLVPAITMSSGASTSVTLDCGDGVQLSESAATDFFIALPPVLFSNGFKVTVTTSEDETKVIETSAANTVLRSSILVMPVVVLDDSGEGAPEEDEEELVIPVSYVNLNSTSLKLYEGDKAQLTATVGPKDATDKVVMWSSSNASVATVDQTGLVTAVSAGTATISGVAGGKAGTCSVTVSALAVATADYVDEYGINHGAGVKIGETVWAPVNCGYHASDFKYGKLYQWGRKYGQGYSGDLYDDWNKIGETSDATVPEFSEGGVSEAIGNQESNSNVFYTGPTDWVDSQNDKLWNSGTESSPVRTESDPCPEGWRVPTYAELNELYQNCSLWTTNSAGQSGYWFSGASSYTESASQIFFPAAGYRYYDGSAYGRGYYGLYWSSRPGDSGAYLRDFYNGYAGMSDSVRAYGYSVRCVEEQ